MRPRCRRGRRPSLSRLRWRAERGEEQPRETDVRERSVKPGFPVKPILAAMLVAGLGCLLGPGNEQFLAALVPRATFDLSCPSEQLQFVVLQHFNGDRRALVSSYGVNGCGRQVSYVLDSTTGAWIMNSDVVPDPQAGIAPAPARPSVPIAAPLGGVAGEQAAVAVEGPEGLGGAGAGSPGTLSPQQVQDALEPVRAEAALCTGGEAGQAVLNLTILGSSGRVVRVNVSGGYQADVRTCIGQVASRAMFPTFADPSQIVSFTLEL